MPNSVRLILERFWSIVFLCCFPGIYLWTRSSSRSRGKQKGRPKDRQTDRQTDRWTDRHTDQTRQTETQQVRMIVEFTRLFKYGRVRVLCHATTVCYRLVWDGMDGRITKRSMCFLLLSVYFVARSSQLVELDCLRLCDCYYISLSKVQPVAQM